MPGMTAALPPGVPPGAPVQPGVPGAAQNPFAALGQLGQLAQGMAATPQGGLPLVNWRDLANAMPTAVPGFQPQGDLDGSTAAMGGLGGSHARRHFQQGDKRLEIEITDTSFNQLLVMPFNMARSVTQDSTTEMQRPSDIAGHPGFLQLRYSNREAKQTLLAHGRFIVEFELRPVAAPEEVLPFTGLVNYALLAQLHAASQAAAATAAPAMPPATAAP